MKALLLLALLPLLLARVEQAEINCSGIYIAEMSWCASELFDESKAVLEKKLSPETIEAMGRGNFEGLL